MNVDELPDLYRSELDEDGVRSLIADLSELEAVEVRLKSGAGHADEELVSLQKAEGSLLDGSIRGAQFVYEHEGKCWSDTVMRARSGFIVVRFEQNFVAPTSE